MQLTSRACELFTKQPAVEQRQSLQVVIEKAAWTGRFVADNPVPNRLKSCAARTRKVIEKKKKMPGQDAKWKFGSSGRIRTYNPSVNSRMLYH
jgi:hypothetical protein